MKWQGKIKSIGRFLSHPQPAIVIHSSTKKKHLIQMNLQTSLATLDLPQAKGILLLIHLLGNPSFNILVIHARRLQNIGYLLGDHWNMVHPPEFQLRTPLEILAKLILLQLSIIKLWVTLSQLFFKILILYFSEATQEYKTKLSLYFSEETQEYKTKLSLLVNTACQLYNIA